MYYQFPIENIVPEEKTVYKKLPLNFANFVKVLLTQFRTGHVTHFIINIGQRCVVTIGYRSVLFSLGSNNYLTTRRSLCMTTQKVGRDTTRVPRNWGHKKIQRMRQGSQFCRTIVLFLSKDCIFVFMCFFRISVTDQDILKMWK